MSEELFQSKSSILKKECDAVKKQKKVHFDSVVATDNGATKKQPSTDVQKSHPSPKTRKKEESSTEFATPNCNDDEFSQANLEYEVEAILDHKKVCIVFGLDIPYNGK